MSGDVSRGHTSPEPPDVAARPVLASVFGFLACVLVGLAGIYAYYVFKVTEPLIANLGAFPEPRLQTDSHADLHQLLAAQRRTLGTYSWVDPAREIVRIPIDRAMQLVLARGEHALDPLQMPPVTPKPGSRGAEAR